MNRRAYAKGKASAQWRIRSRIGRGGSVDDTGRVPFPHTVLSSDLWLLVLLEKRFIEIEPNQPDAQPTPFVQEQAERPDHVAMPPVPSALRCPTRGMRPAL